eukprot:4191506-Pyramimonas_sp.AAC.1
MQRNATQSTATQCKAMQRDCNALQCDCNALRLQRKAMQRNAIAVRLKCDCNAARREDAMPGRRRTGTGPPGPHTGS